EFITKLIQHNIPIIVASSGILAKIQFNLKETGLSDYFSQIISADGIKNGKPHPEIFLLAAERLKIPINECIVIEDSVTGVSAGKASGAFTVAITTTFPAKKLNQADLVVKKFEEIPLDLLFR
ncbi:MAG: HAD family hydrolase, partial [Promethearchaeota archaeon]